MTRRYVFNVYGLPAPQGSKSGFIHPHAKTQRGTPLIVMRESSKKVKPWRDDVKRTAEEVLRNADGSMDPPIEGAVRVRITFTFLRLASHLNAKGELRASAPRHKITYPDLSKLVRSTEDAMTKLVWKDDAQIVAFDVVKRFGDVSGAQIEVEEVE